ncbi:hypothetical protein EHI8A_165740 [Entamoeba histolytica HM-1:IMSS-B]|uniref:Uncharacterized protein n=5 Tax=Entamoeba histolytica TaxID=5759 RepID=B1N349_ENTH1|nr:hypothetical protein EHI_138000 [Entamoeba histolytica HM-1:IMSS]EDS89611.1 hypothetical protein EHI_138000 [Entamoeba histolytica HM-1:IMSS]EMH77565.1 hypothetical protein EHI8A_165740 [Entamoeba histolytica HM-1:IMSS-B]EMS15704.1 hypothetical protein KM1_237390 [Entamoeba histolytica HM-3:IMSS]ENY66022.1 hypothetical protein EHI7A_147430 [Entamoeba histolytica HM-1:IMSS-A]|eukprot:XP_001913615.1 hypothetical protein EHI_138000 [Entamoeba histolytica HM-1:IMSS]
MGILSICSAFSYLDDEYLYYKDRITEMEFSGKQYDGINFVTTLTKNPHCFQLLEKTKIPYEDDDTIVFNVSHIHPLSALVTLSNLIFAQHENPYFLVPFLYPSQMMVLQNYFNISFMALQSGIVQTYAKVNQTSVIIIESSMITTVSVYEWKDGLFLETERKVFNKGRIERQIQLGKLITRQDSSPTEIFRCGKKLDEILANKEDFSEKNQIPFCLVTSHKNIISTLEEFYTEIIQYIKNILPLKKGQLLYSSFLIGYFEDLIRKSPDFKEWNVITVDIHNVLQNKKLDKYIVTTRSHDHYTLFNPYIKKSIPILTDKQLNQTLYINITLPSNTIHLCELRGTLDFSLPEEVIGTIYLEREPNKYQVQITGSFEITVSNFKPEITKQSIFYEEYQCHTLQGEENCTTSLIEVPIKLVLRKDIDLAIRNKNSFIMESKQLISKLQIATLQFKSLNYLQDGIEWMKRNGLSEESLILSKFISKSSSSYELIEIADLVYDYVMENSHEME